MTRVTRTVAGLLALAIVIPIFAHAALININTADAALLDTLPGIGPSKAAAIVDYRAKNGLFATTTDIQKVSGIGPVTFVKLKELITVDVANSSSTQGTASAARQLQLFATTTSYKKEQSVEPIISAKKNIQTHEEAVIAPAAATEFAAAGAALLPPTLSAEVPTSDVGTAPAAKGIFKSLWTFGLLGVITLAGGAFIFL